MKKGNHCRAEKWDGCRKQISLSQCQCSHVDILCDIHMGPEDNFCSTKISKDSVLAKLPDLIRGFRICKF